MNSFRNCFHAVRAEKGKTPLVKPALQLETETALRLSSGETVPPRRPNVIAGVDRHAAGLRPVASPATQKPHTFQTRVPVITGEATYRGYLPVDGVISGQLTASGSALMVKQRVRSDSDPELDGELSFKDLLRINGHIRGKVQSERGTLIVDDAATVDAQIEVGVAIISGEVNGDVFARERVELGHGAVINGNISTPLLSIKPGATFHGDCRMLKTAG
ncbi:MAG: bactofilin family protein [Pyrinomonadaceae bacterium]